MQCTNLARSCVWDVIVILLALTAQSGSAAAQGPPLPSAMYAEYASTDLHEFSLFPSEEISDVSRISALVSFHTGEQVVEFEWWYKDDDALPDFDLESHSVGYQPTAICPQAGRGPVMFVAGYLPVSGDVIIEKWTVVGLTLVSYAGPSGVMYSGLAKSIRKQVVFVSSDVSPVRAMAFSASTSQLFLLEEDAPNKAWSLDPETATLGFLFDSSTVPEISTLYSAKSIKILPSAPDGGGCAILLFPWRGWSRGWSDAYGVADLTAFYIMRDEGCSGTLDESGVLTYAEYRDVRNYPQSWDLYFSAN